MVCSRERYTKIGSGWLFRTPVSDIHPIGQYIDMNEGHLPQEKYSFNSSCDQRQQRTTVKVRIKTSKMSAFSIVTGEKL